MSWEPTTTKSDQDFMREALQLAQSWLGQVWPNPSVGCVIVKSGQVVGRGFTQRGGRPHAEAEALKDAGAAARGATVYVTLEPCSHHGKSPPCADALIKAGISRVVSALEDPDNRVAGQGHAKLRDAGIEVETGVCTAEAAELNAGFLLHRTVGRPFVTLKIATSLDGKVALRNGESKWITGEAARLKGHELRANHDAILVGSGTVRADDPELTCRLPGHEHRSPVRVILDSNARIPKASRLVATAKVAPVWVVGDERIASSRVAELSADGVEFVPTVLDSQGRVDAFAAVRALAARGITRLLVEGGARVATSFLTAKLVDQIVWFRSASYIGNDGIPAIGDLGLDAMKQIERFERSSVQLLGPDLEEVLRRPK